MEVIEMVGQTMAKVVPVTIGLALVFTVLSHFWACNPGKPWWRKRELVTDICYWFFVPVFARVFRIGLLVLGAGFVFDIHDVDALVAFYDNGHGPLSELPLWVQALLFLVASDFMLYWLHRMFHGGAFWKYHAIHHSSEELEWISAARFHPVNLFIGTIMVDVILLMAWHLARHIMLWVGPFTTFHSAFVRQSELDARPVQVRPRHGVSTAGITSLEEAAAPFREHLSRSGTSCSERSGFPKAGCRFQLRHRRSAVVPERDCRSRWPIRSGNRTFRAKACWRDCDLLP
jgi:sterol desaturase/sphingolipid hydroxylase (fatty acid hydroxylase superfamily)